MKSFLYFGTYNPHYARNRVLLKGLRVQGATVRECTARSLAALWWQYRAVPKDFDAMIVGFPGQKVMLLARWLTRKPIIFNAFTSHYGGYILDRKVASPRSFRARWYRWLDRTSCRLANLVLLDTDAHIDFFVREFGLPRAKFRRVFVGTDSSIFHPSRSIRHQSFLVHFHGSGIPLQGIEYIRAAQKILEPEGIQFQIITNANRVPYEQLPELMTHADVCLGIFGDSPKTDLVIPNKIYEALAMGKPVITADTPAIRELVRDRETALLCTKADARDLAAKIMLLRDNPSLCEHIARQGYELFQRRLTEQQLGFELLHEINALPA